MSNWLPPSYILSLTFVSNIIAVKPLATITKG